MQCGSIVDAGECASNVLCDACVDFSGSLIGCIDADVPCAAAFPGASYSSNSIWPIIGGVVGGLIVIGVIFVQLFLVVRLVSQCVASRLVSCVCLALLTGRCLPNWWCLRAWIKNLNPNNYISLFKIQWLSTRPAPGWVVIPLCASEGILFLAHSHCATCSLWLIEYCSRIRRKMVVVGESLETQQTVMDLGQRQVHVLRRLLRLQTCHYKHLPNLLLQQSSLKYHTRGLPRHNHLNSQVSQDPSKRTMITIAPPLCKATGTSGQVRHVLLLVSNWVSGNGELLVFKLNSCLKRGRIV